MLRIRRREGSMQVRAEIPAGISHVFERVTDHEAMAEWPGIQRCRLLEPGEPRNGLGAVRRITAFGLTLDERVVGWDPPNGYEYQIIRGLPVVHHGQIRLVERGRNRTELEWTVELESRIPLLAAGVAAALRAGLPRALRYFAGSFAN
jgi:hypothetical protein